MSSASSNTLKFYPAYCWSVSPTYNVWAKLSAANIHALTQRPGFEGQRVYFHRNHPIRYIRLVGLVTSFDAATESTILTGAGKVAKTVKTPWTFTLDDGSGENIDIVCWRDDTQARLATQPGELIQARYADRHKRPGRTVTGKDINLDEVELGKVVKVRGWIDQFRGRRQILLERVAVVEDTAAEVVAWEELAEFQKTVLAVPWALTTQEVAALWEKVVQRQRRLAKTQKRRADGAGGNGAGSEEKTHRTRVVPTKIADEKKASGRSSTVNPAAHGRPAANTKMARVST